jgi:hypothetical protein
MIILFFKFDLFISLTTNLTVSSGSGVRFSSSGVDLISKFINKFSDIFFEDKSIIQTV